MIATDQNLCFGGVFAYHFDRLSDDPIPYFAITLAADFIEKFKGHVFSVKTLGKFLPEIIEDLLVMFVFKEAVFVFSRIEAETHRLMKIQDHVQIVFFTPIDAVFNPLEAIFTIGQVFV